MIHGQHRGKKPSTLLDCFYPRFAWALTTTDYYARYLVEAVSVFNFVMSSPSPFAKPPSIPEIDTPVARAVQKLQYSLEALTTTVDSRIVQISTDVPQNKNGDSTSSAVDNQENSRLAHKLSTLLGLLLNCMQKVQRAGTSHIDDEVDASYLLEMN